METTLAILMVLGIFIGVPAAIDFTIAGTLVLADRRVVRAKRQVEVLGEAQVKPA